MVNLKLTGDHEGTSHLEVSMRLHNVLASDRELSSGAELIGRIRGASTAVPQLHSPSF